MYVFLSASLPELSLGQPPPIDVAGFDELMREVLPECRCNEISALSLPLKKAETEASGKLLSVLKQFESFERFLRTRIAGLRAKKLETDCVLPEPESFFADIDKSLNEAVKITNPVERELFVDRLRWEYLDELEAEHSMDLIHLCIYRIRLQILSGYRGRNFESGQKFFETALNQVSGRQ